VKAVAGHGVSIALACRTFQVSESCYRYERKLSDENAEIADWLEKLIQHAEQLRERGIDFHIVNLGADTSTADGMLVFTVIAAMAEHERKRLSERAKQGLEAARKRGVKFGPKPKMSDRQIRNAKAKLEKGEISVAKLARYYGVHPWTMTRSIRRLDAR